MNLWNKLRTQLHQPWFGGAVGATLAIFCGVCFLVFPFGKGLRDWSYDLPFLLQAEKTIDDVVIVYLDEKSYPALGQDPATFDRGLHAKLLDRLKKDGAKNVVFDVLFIDTNRAITAGDSEFAKAIQRFGKVTLGGQYYEDNHFLKNSGVIPPINLLRDAATNWGLVKIHRDTDFSARRHHPGTEMVPSLAWKSAELFGAEITKDSKRRGEERWLNYYSPEPFQAISYSDAISSQPLPKSFSFHNKTVFVGSGEVAGYTGDEKEQFRYPWTWLTGHFPYGVEVHALTYSNLVRQDWLRRLPLFLEIILISILGALLGYGFSLFRPL